MGVGLGSLGQQDHDGRLEIDFQGGFIFGEAAQRIGRVQWMAPLSLHCPSENSQIFSPGLDNHGETRRAAGRQLVSGFDSSSHRNPSQSPSQSVWAGPN